ncbi:MAG TPA: non-canonical purine NTP pyrophosphatase [Candidatus Saccharimonadales bacterium]|nr:non-canonical purine NTP pyrophosphatase [Candidatus Saccharimonadales bacterium]
MNDPTFITGNQNKADFLAKHLGVPVAHHKLDLDEIQSLDPHVVVEHKVRQAYEALHTPVLVEDAGLIFTAMGQLPGTFIKWFIEEIGYDGLLRLAHSLPDQTAVGRVCYGLYDGTNMHFFDGEMRGRIADEARDEGRGFGFDPIFINDGFTKTRAQMTEEEYDITSYRTDAISKLREYLQNAAAA